eukprot:g3981.t1
MLQQTQVVKVIDYFNQWMERWPNVEQLAKADLDDVREMWAGLGYYSRASNLLKGAQFVMETFQGEFPRDVNQLMRIPGVGAYTSRAIASIAMNTAAAVVDGNVIRVLARLHTISEDPKKQHKLFQSLANARLNTKRPGDHNQAMMELGAMICRPMNPQCEICPVKRNCMHKKTSKGKFESMIKVTDYPLSVKKPEKQKQTVDVFVLHLLAKEEDSCSFIGRYLMLKRPATGLLAGMWEFPTLPSPILDNSNQEHRLEAITTFLSESCGIDLNNKAMYRIIDRKQVGEVVHIFSHIHMTLRVELLVIEVLQNELCFHGTVQYKWVTDSEMNSIGLCSMVKKVYNKLIKQNTTTFDETKDMNMELDIPTM